jgi:nucleotidyltransferase/DNA polymerase involved in DNA repair
MSVACCQIPDFLILIACQQHPKWQERPLALVGPDNQLWAISPQAKHLGIRTEMSLAQAQIYCPEIVVGEIDLGVCENQQAEFLASIHKWQLPVEVLGWGRAYVDMQLVGRAVTTVRSLVVELGQAVRQTLGNQMQPSLGWDSGKFTASAAADWTSPGRIKLVDKENELNFLKPLPVALLPLPTKHLQQLEWLGIYTLGQFASMPRAAVWQRFGKVGKLAHLWAQGRDDRAVEDNLPKTQATTSIAIDPPSGLLHLVQEAVVASVKPRIEYLSQNLVGLRQLRITLEFVPTSQVSVDLVFVEPVGQIERFKSALSSKLCSLSWKGKVQRVHWQILATGELRQFQTTLFDEIEPQFMSLELTVGDLVKPYGSYLLGSHLVDPRHPVPSRRSSFFTLTARS